MWALRILLLLYACAAANVACAASFNCAKAVTPQEKAICASPELSEADDRMAAQYREILRWPRPMRLRKFARTCALGSAGCQAIVRLGIR